ncbi:MAG TPA: hypothetical protein DCQ93_02335 [Bacteroidetes bacterium]|nr:hypothetical protein [Bacteroidota bacterium]
MVTVKKEQGNFVFEVQGLHKLWAFKSQITIPVEHISKVYPNEENMNWIWGLRLPGTNIPGLITAGTYFVKDGIIFCDISDSKKCVVIELHDEHYNKLIIEVEDLKSTIDLLMKK